LNTIKYIYIDISACFPIFILLLICRTFIILEMNLCVYIGYTNINKVGFTRKSAISLIGVDMNIQYA